MLQILEVQHPIFIIKSCGFTELLCFLGGFMVQKYWVTSMAVVSIVELSVSNLWVLVSTDYLVVIMEKTESRNVKD